MTIIAPHLTDEQFDAVERLVLARPQKWKGELAQLWASGNPQTPDEVILYALHKTHGARWLNQYRFKRDRLRITLERMKGGEEERTVRIYLPGGR